MSLLHVLLASTLLSANLFAVGVYHQNTPGYYPTDTPLDASTQNVGNLTPAAQCIAVKSVEAASAPPQKKEEASACSGVDKNLSCACQVSEILEKAGIDIKPTASVDDLVSQLKNKHWAECGANKAGGVGFTQKAFNKRSHISSIDKNGCATHNSGAEGGEIVQTPLPGSAGPCNSNNAGGGPMNMDWVNSLKFLCPPPSEGASCPI